MTKDKHGNVVSTTVFDKSGKVVSQTGEKKGGLPPWVQKDKMKSGFAPGEIPPSTKIGSGEAMKQKEESPQKGKVFDQGWGSGKSGQGSGQVFKDLFRQKGK